MSEFQAMLMWTIVFTLIAGIVILLVICVKQQNQIDELYYAHLKLERKVR